MRRLQSLADAFVHKGRCHLVAAGLGDRAKAQLVQTSTEVQPRAGSAQLQRVLHTTQDVPAATGLVAKRPLSESNRAQECLCYARRTRSATLS